MESGCGPLPRDLADGMDAEDTSAAKAVQPQPLRVSVFARLGQSTGQLQLTSMYREVKRRGGVNEESSDKIAPSPSQDSKTGAVDTFASGAKMYDEQVLTAQMQKQALTDFDKYKILDARDELLRLRGERIRSASSTYLVGTCRDMCPEKERYLRAAKNQLSRFEKLPNDRGADPRAVVKEYTRSSADQAAPLPHELRPSLILAQTLAHLLCNVIDKLEDPQVPPDWFSFVWSATRALRKDVTQQQLSDPEAVHVVEKCARFHVVCAARLLDENPASFDVLLNDENLTKCLQSLKHMYEDARASGNASLAVAATANEAEFLAYDVLLHLNNNGGESLRSSDWKDPALLADQRIRMALDVLTAVDSSNYVRFFKLVKKANILQACVMVRYFFQVRSRALEVLCQASGPRSNPIALDMLSRILAFESDDDCVDFCMKHDIRVDATSNAVFLDKKAFKHPDKVPAARRARLLVESKRTAAWSEVINGSPVVDNPYESYVPSNSFDERGFYIRRTEYVAVQNETANLPAERVASFFTKEGSKLSKFRVGKCMRLAPVHRVTLDPERLRRLEQALATEATTRDNYLKELSTRDYVAGCSKKTWPFDDVMADEETKAKRAKLRPKLLQFSENLRPAYWGTWTKKSKLVRPLNPFGREEQLFAYDYDSGDDWGEDEEEQDESLSDEEKDKEVDVDTTEMPAAAASPSVSGDDLEEEEEQYELLPDTLSDNEEGEGEETTEMPAAAAKEKSKLARPLVDYDDDSGDDWEEEEDESQPDEKKDKAQSSKVRVAPQKETAEMPNEKSKVRVAATKEQSQKTKVDFTATMRGLVVATSGWFDNSKRKLKLKRMIEEMGGTFAESFAVDGSFSVDITHLVAKEVRAASCVAAARRQIPVMTEEWVEEAWKRGRREKIHAADMHFAGEYACSVDIDAHPDARVRSLLEEQQQEEEDDDDESDEDEESDDATEPDKVFYCKRRCGYETPERKRLYWHHSARQCLPTTCDACGFTAMTATVDTHKQRSCLVRVDQISSEFERFLERQKIRSTMKTAFRRCRRCGVFIKNKKRQLRKHDNCTNPRGIFNGRRSAVVFARNRLLKFDKLDNIEKEEKSVAELLNSRRGVITRLYDTMDSLKMLMPPAEQSVVKKPRKSGGKHRLFTPRAHVNFLEEPELEAEAEEVATTSAEAERPQESSSMRRNTFQSKKPYERSEDEAMLKYIIKKKRFSEITGTKLWKQMEEKEVLVGRTWQSMHERFRKKIRTNLDNFDLSEEDKKALSPRDKKKKSNQ